MGWEWASHYAGEDDAVHESELLAGVQIGGIRHVKSVGSVTWAPIEGAFADSRLLVHPTEWNVKDELLAVEIDGLRLTFRCVGDVFILFPD